MLKQQIVFFILVISFLVVGTGILAETQEITAEDLQVNASEITLPDNPLYFLKSWKRAIAMTFTFGSVKKAELQQRINNEKLLELEALALKTKNFALLEKATENYKQGVTKLANRVEKIKATAETNPEVQKFLDKFVNQSTLHQKILDKLSEKVPSQVMEKIEAARQNHLEKFNQVMTKLENRTEKQLEIIESLKEQVQTKKIGCQNLWWFDNGHKFCQQGKWCGAYMYLGLRTFETKEECESALNVE